MLLKNLRSHSEGYLIERLSSLTDELEHRSAGHSRRRFEHDDDLFLLEGVATITKELLRGKYNIERVSSKVRKDVRRQSDMKLRTYL